MPFYRRMRLEAERQAAVLEEEPVEAIAEEGAKTA